MINLRKAIQLAEILDPHVPETPELDTPILEFVGKILENIANSGHHADYLVAAEILTGIDQDSLIEMGVDRVTHLFIQGLIDNKFMALLEFYRGIRNNGR